jgi:hypothetical protein
MRGEGDDHFKGKTGRKFPFCSPARMEMKSGRSRGFKYKIWRDVTARWGRPTQGFGRPHMGLSGLHYFLTGWGAQGGPRASGFGFYLCAEDFKKCRILLGL